MSATITPIDAEGQVVNYGQFYIVPSGLVYVAGRQAFATSQMIYGLQHKRKRARGWVEVQQVAQMISADVLLPIGITDLDALPIKDAVRRGRDLYSSLYRAGPASERQHRSIEEHRRQVAVARTKMLRGE